MLLSSSQFIQSLRWGMQSEQRHPRRGTAPCRGWVEARGAPDLGRSPYPISSPCKKHVIKANKLLRGRCKTLACFILHSLQMVVFSTHCSHVRQEHGVAETSPWPGLNSDTPGKGLLALRTQNKPAYSAQHSPAPQRSKCLKALHQGEDAFTPAISLSGNANNHTGWEAGLHLQSNLTCYLFYLPFLQDTKWHVACGITQPSKASPPLQIN